MHQARELKSVQVDAPALLVRLVVTACHANKFNTYNQVSARHTLSSRVPSVQFQDDILAMWPRGKRMLSTFSPGMLLRHATP